MLEEKRSFIYQGWDILQRPDSFGRFGKFGGKFVPETVMYALAQLESAFYALSSDHDFQVRQVCGVKQWEDEARRTN